MREWIARLRDWFRRDELERELAEELHWHRQQSDLNAEVAAADPGSARERAARRRAAEVRAREAAWERWSIPFLDPLQQDMRHALRGLRRSPGFAVAVIITLGLGIGANAAMFTMVDRLMFRPLAYMRAPDRVHRIYWQWFDQGSVITTSSTQYARYLDLRRWTTSFSQLAAFYERNLLVGQGEAARERRVAAVSASFFQLFDARPALGRFFVADEDVTPVGAEVAVLSWSFWQTEYGGRNVLGEALEVGDVHATIIGVAPAGFRGVNDADPTAIFVPITTYAGTTGTGDAKTYFTQYKWGWVNILVRRAPGVTVEQAEADARLAFRRSWEAGQEDDPSNPLLETARPRVAVAGVRPGAGPNPSLEARTALWLSIVAAIVLIIAAANVASLFLSRALKRRREMAVRLALGAGRARLLAQTWTESLLLTTLGGIAALLVARWIGDALGGLLLADDAAMWVVVDRRTLRLTLLLVVVTGLAVGLVPAMAARPDDLAKTLRSGAGGGVAQGARMRAALLLVQGALSVVLLIGAALFVRSLDAVKAMPLGYEPDHVLLVNRVLRSTQFNDSIQLATRRMMLEAAQSLPIVESAAWMSSAPFVSTSDTQIFVAGIDSVQKLGLFTYQATTSDYFRTMGTRILRGRALSDADRAGAPGAAVVSESMARVLWPGHEALGQCFHMRSDTLPCMTVVGIAEDMVQRSLTREKRYHFYVPIEQYTRTWGNGMLLRVRGDPGRESENIRRAIQRVMPGGSYVTTRTLGDIVGSQQRSWRLGATMSLAFGLLALIVAAVGLYGVVSYDVGQRMHELSIRVALGARREAIIRLVVRRCLELTVSGALLGTAIALGLSRWIQPLLFEQSATDPRVYTAVGVLLIAVALLASATPAWRAAGADPNAALRAE